MRLTMASPRPEPSPVLRSARQKRCVTRSRKLGRHARTVIVDLDGGLPRHLDLYACAFGRMLYGILGEITDCLPQRLAIAVDVDRGVRADHPNFLALLHGQRSH